VIKIPTLIGGNDEAVKKQFGDLFADAQSGMRRVITFGIFALGVKLTQLKHSQFGDWVKGNFGESAYRTVRSHMQLTESTLEACGIKQLKPIFQNGSALPISKCGDFLMLPEAKVPEPLKPLREKICNIVDGKSARALFTEFKQAEEEITADGASRMKKRRGRLPGQGGATAAQREAARLRAEQEALEELKREYSGTTKWCDANANDKKAKPLFGTKEWDRLEESLNSMATYMKRAKERFAKGGAQ